MAPRGMNPTGFDVKKFVASTGMGTNDPWARREAWRYTGPFSTRNRFKGLFPGFGIATVAFAAYCGFEYFLLNDNHGHGDRHGSGHGEEKH